MFFFYLTVAERQKRTKAMCHQPASCLCKGQHRSAEKPGLCSFSKFLPFYCSRRSRGPGLMFSTGITNHRNKHKRNALWGPYGVDIFNLSTLGQAISVSLSLVACNIVPLGSQQMPRTFIFMTVIKLDRNKQNSLIAETAYQNLRYSSGIWELRSLHICFKVSPRLCTIMCLHHQGLFTGTSRSGLVQLPAQRQPVGERGSCLP